RERWKIYFEEFAVPLVVALFIAILPVNFHPINVTTIAAVLFFLLFLLSGKGLVNTFFRARAEIGRLAERHRRRRAYRNSVKEMNAAQEEWRVAAAEWGELDAEKAYKINVLNSE